MLFNLHILPLLGGFLFVTFWNRTRLIALRYEGQRLIFNSAICGFIFTILSLVILKIPILGILLNNSISFLFASYLNEIHDFQVDILAFLLSITLVLPINRFIFKADLESLNAIERVGSQLEKKMMQSLRDEKPVLVVLKTRKFYVGYITEGIDLSSDRTFFTIFPLLSGYQHEATLQHLQLFDYSHFYQRLIGKNVSSKDTNEITSAYDSRICIKTDDVVTIRIYEPDLKSELSPNL